MPMHGPIFSCMHTIAPAYKDSNIYICTILIPQITACHLSEPSTIPMHGPPGYEADAWTAIKLLKPPTSNKVEVHHHLLGPLGPA